MDTYTSAATPLPGSDAIMFFPQIYHHYPTSFIKQSDSPRYDDGLLEARLGFSRRSGSTISYVSRRSWLRRGPGRVRQSQTCFFDGTFDSASTAVAQGLWQVENETWLVGCGAQFTHAGLDNWTLAGVANVTSGLQRLRLRRNGFMSLSTSAENASSAGLLQTVPLPRPTHCTAGAAGTTGHGGGFKLELNLVTDIGRGTVVYLLDTDDGDKVVAVSEPLVGVDDVAVAVTWTTAMPPGNLSHREYAIDGCAYTSKEFPSGRPCPRPGRPASSSFIPCHVDIDCIFSVPFEPGTCNSAPVVCLNSNSSSKKNESSSGGVCGSRVAGGDVCGVWREERTMVSRGSDLSQLWHVGANRSLRFEMFATDLYSLELVCKDD
jgi:hypothetical protein